MIDWEQRRRDREATRQHRLAVEATGFAEDFDLLEAVALEKAEVDRDTYRVLHAR